VDHHMRTAFALVDPEASAGDRVQALGRVLKFYPAWYATRWVGRGQLPSYGEFGKLAPHLRFAERATRRLARSILHAMVRFGPKLERRQMVLFRIVDIGAELFAMAAACVRAQMLAGEGRPEAVTLADVFCRQARGRILRTFGQLFDPGDVGLTRLSRDVLDGKHAWLEAGIMGLKG
jgi:hypothetical protein